MLRGARGLISLAQSHSLPLASLRCSERNSIDQNTKHVVLVAMRPSNQQVLQDKLHILPSSLVEGTMHNLFQ